MKKQLFNVLLCCLMTLPAISVKADVVADEQTTEGTDFWVTFLQADQGGSKFALDLAISSRYHSTVTVSNPFTGKSKTYTVEPNKTQNVPLDQSTDGADNSDARTRQKETGLICYAFNSEQVDTCALHIVSDSAISLFASNYQYASFDAANVLPKPSLQNEYYIQTYSPSDNAGSSSSQGSHFCIIATEDSTVAEYILTANTIEHSAGDTVKTPPLKQGQVWYVWTGSGWQGDGDTGDLSGTYIKANKKIAVFQGCPHTNIPYQIHLRDHIFSQAMPTSTWGNTFVLTGSKGRKRDIFRVMALEDGTEVYIKTVMPDNTVKDSLYYTFNFSKNPKHYWEFEMGEEVVKGGYTNKETELVQRPAPTVVGQSCVLTTSCPAAVHLFIVSQTWDGDKSNNGDPAMLWVNPIEQQINQITFTTYDSKKDGNTAHHVNIVTADKDGMMLGATNIANQFKRVQGSDKYWYAQYELGGATNSYTLKNTNGNFIAHVYGFTANESYGYNAGGSAKPLNAAVIINGKEFIEGEDNIICGGKDGNDSIEFACELDFIYDSIYWFFGDGKDTLVYPESPAVKHYYEHANEYKAYVLIHRTVDTSDKCDTRKQTPRIDFRVNVGSYKVDIKGQYMPECTKKGDEVDFEIYLENESKISLQGDSVKFSFHQTAIDDGFTDEGISYRGDTALIVRLPKEAKEGVEYGLHLHIGSPCPDNTLDKDLTFQLKYAKTLLVQRYDNVLGLVKDSFPNQTLSDFVWLHDGDTIKNQHGAVLYLDTESPSGEYRVCYTIHEEGKEDIDDCACPVQFKAPTERHQFDDSNLQITATYSPRGKQVFVNAARNDNDAITCSAEWIDVSGRVLERYDIPSGGGLINTPAEGGFYLLRVSADGGCRSFKMFIND